MMNENEMGYRGSKSSLFKYNSQPVRKNKGVKEQRVDGSWCFLKGKHLRCTLTGFERSYQVKIPSNQLFKRSYSTSGKLLNPNFVTGFTDAEGCFTLSIFSSNKVTTKIRVMARFKIGLNEKDLPLLLQIQEFFGGIGTITYSKTNNAYVYSVSNVTELLKVIIPHFMNYPLLSQKAADFNLFVQIIQLMNKGAHLNYAGLQQIVNIKAYLNKGNSEFILSKFPIINPVKREIIETTNISDPHWISGFVSGDGNFDAGIRKATNTRKERVYLRFRVTQHNRDLKLMELIIKYFGAGRIECVNRTENSTVNVVIGNFSDISNKILPFFDQYHIFGVKYLDYLDWANIANIMILGKHKTPEGFEKIKLIEARMNKGRKTDF
jgi:hypothetical protein